ncbi:MAG TPA: aspartate kinase [Bacteroidales bacterium]|mgnify:FL=1|nr:aspartate kinase [Bacteroidales bacterium]HQK71154.1 aspartate kinase [Bacteroidales bacterium]
MKIMKFGGTSVGTAERMRAIVPLINTGEKVIVVLSAMSGTTNALIEISSALYAGNIKEAGSKIESLRAKYLDVVNNLYTHEETRQTGREIIDNHFNYISGFINGSFTRTQEKAIVAQGELLSTALFHLLLQEQNINSALIPALNFMRIDKYGEPDIYYITENLKRELENYPDTNIIITQGFICRNAFGEIDNLKRGGSDYTASLIGAALDASEIQIWTDINGFHNNDPRYVENTFPVRELSFDEAAELAYFGAKVLHPSTVNPARDKNIPVRLKNTMEPDDPGTLISRKQTFKDYKAIAAKDGITAIRIKSDRMLMAYGFLRKVFEIFEVYRTPIDMITTSEVSVALTIDNPENLPDILKELQNLGTVEIEENQSIICIVGDFRPETTGSAPEIFEALNTLPIKMIAYGGSPYNLSLLVDTKNKVQALRLLNKHLFKEQK